MTDPTAHSAHSAHSAPSAPSAPSAHSAHSAPSAHPEPVEGEPVEGPAQTLPQFTPVPRLKDRSNGWKPEVQRAFIEALAETGSVRAACRRVGRTEHGAYQMRRHPEGESFRAAWQAALDIGIQKIEDIAMDRAINGVEEPFWAYGKLVGTRTRYNDRLLMFMLRNRAPERFAGGGAAKAMNAADKTTLARLKKQWRAEWERERAIEDYEDEQKTFEEIDQWLDTMHQNRRANMSPRARAAYAEAERIAKEDGTAWMLDEIEEAEDAEFEACPEPPEPVEGRREVVAEEETEAKQADGPEKPELGPKIRSLKDDGW